MKALILFIILLTCLGVGPPALAQQPHNNGQPAGTAGNLTATAATSASCGGTSCVTLTTTGYASATVTVHGTYSGSTINFEVSDDSGTTYYPVQCSETNVNIQESSKALGTNAVLAWRCGIFAGTNFEVRQSAISTGTAVVKITLSAAAIDPAPNITIATNGNSINQATIVGTTVDVNSGTKSAGTQRVVLATDQPQLTNKLLVTPDANVKVNIVGNGGANLDAATSQNVATPTNGITVLGEFNTTPTTITNGNSSPIQVDPLGQTTVTMGATSSVTNATSRCILVSAASTNATNCKNGAGNVYGYRFVNTTTTIYYLRMYNLTTSPTCSSATGFIESIPIPPAGASGQAGGIVSIEPMGEAYSTGIGFCFTGGSSSTDNTNAATGVFGTILYK